MGTEISARGKRGPCSDGEMELIGFQNFAAGIGFGGIGIWVIWYCD